MVKIDPLFMEIHPNEVCDKKENWGREEKMEIDHCKIETMVPKRFH